jgi:membrane-associated phospholipid phosphatase
MLRRIIQTAVWKYDRLLASVVALLPASLQPLSSKLGKVTLPIIWASFLLLLSSILALTGNQQMALIGIVTILCIPIGTVLKLIVRRARPKTIYAQNMKIKSYSFPSSHTYAATVAGGFTILVILATVPAPINVFFSVIYTAIIAIIGISRVHVGAHYPTDVTAGWILGAGVLYCLSRFVQ